MLRNLRKGFTLIELMIVVAIIGILAAIAIPKFASLIRKSSEGACKGSLGAIRASLSIYYGDMEGQYPTNLAAMTIAGKYLNPVPSARAPNYHADNSVATEGASSSADGGGWLFNNLSGDANLGSVFVNCTHTDTKGSIWTTY